MILFAIHLSIAVALGYILIRAVVESGRKDLLIPIAGIVTLFAIHCLTFRESCLQCSLIDSRCVAEILMFWFFAGWAGIRLLTDKKKS